MPRFTVVNPYQKYEDDAGTALSGGSIRVYDNNTTTDKDIFSDPDLTVSQSNPYTLDAAGRITGDVYFSGTASIEVFDSGGASIRTDDDVICFDTFNTLTDNVANDSSIVLLLTHETAGVPVVPIGTGLGFATETSANNNETGMIIEAVTTDVTPGSEDFKFNLKLMQGGASASSVMEITGSYIAPTTTDTLALGTATLMWSDAYLASGAVINFNNGDITLSHSADTLTMAGGKLSLAELDFTAGGVSVTQILDEDDFSSDSETALATQQSIKAYVLQRGQDLVLDERTSNTILVATDASKYIKITSGTFTQTFTAAATLGANWRIIYHNAGTGDVTLNPDGSEQIDGLTSFVMYPGECRIIQCNGSKLSTILLQGFKKTFTADGTFTKPPGYSAFAGLLWSAGASGSTSVTGESLAIVGGGGGGCYPFTLEASLFGTTETITIGEGGASVSGSDASGNPGENSSIGTLLTVYGAEQPVFSTATALGGSIGVGAAVHDSGDTASFASSDAGSNTLYGGTTADGTGPAGDSLYGGAAGGSLDTSAIAQDPGTSTYGGDGGAANNGSNATAGTAPAGGGGASKDASSGAGARGELRIWGVI